MSILPFLLTAQRKGSTHLLLFSTVQADHHGSWVYNRGGGEVTGTLAAYSNGCDVYSKRKCLALDCGICHGFRNRTATGRMGTPSGGGRRACGCYERRFVPGERSAIVDGHAYKLGRSWGGKDWRPLPCGRGSVNGSRWFTEPRGRAVDQAASESTNSSR